MLKRLFALFFVLSLSVPGFAISAKKSKVSLLLYNGKVFTADDRHGFAQAVAIDGNRITAVGSDSELRSKYSGAKEIDLKGKLVTPGFNDSHIHFLGVGLALLRVDLNGSKSVEEAKSRIAAKIKELPKGAWVLGRGWDHTLWNNRLPTKEDLDSISPDNPVFVQRVDGHLSWANSLAFKLAKIDKSTKDPEGGEIVRKDDGEPAGVLKETSQGLVGRVVPDTTPEELLNGMRLAVKEAKSYGLTSVQGGTDFESIPLYKKLLDEGELSVRVAVWQDFESPVATLEKQRSDFASMNIDKSRLKLGILKGYMDGTLGSRTAAMIEPFADDPQNKGIPRMPAEQMIKMIVERDKAGFQIGLHAIGDQANRTALDGFELARKENGAMRIRRHRMEHAQVVHPQDFKRFADLDVIASMQPTHAITDKRWAPDRLGDYRVLGAYSWKTFEAYKVHLAFGTDAPVESLNTYLTLYAAVTREAEEGGPAGGWLPEQKLSMAEAIRSYTAESAYAEFAENEKGTIKPGMLADLIVHNKDLFTIPHKEILNTRPFYTIFNGRVL